MAFVYSNWYIVMAVLVVAIIALVTVFVMMDKKDRVLIQKFIDSSSASEEPKQESVKTEVEEKANE